MYIYIYKICHRSLFRGHFEPWNCYLFGERCVGWTNETKPREKERGGREEFADITIWPARNPLLAKLWSYRAATCQLQATPIENVGRSSRVQGAPREFQSPDDRYRREEDPTILRQAWPLRYSNRRKRLPRPLSRTRYRFEMEFLERIDIRSWKLWRNATPSCELVTLRLVFFIVGHTLRNLRVSLLSNIQRVPSSHSRPMNRERDRFFRHRGRREEKREMDPLGGAQIGSFALPTSHAYASIMNHSRGESEFFFPGTKEICFEGCDQFSILTANSSRLLDPRAKIRACLFPNCHRGRGGTERDERRDRHWWI